MTATRSASLMTPHAAISSVVRPQPMQSADKGSTTQILTQGVEISEADMWPHLGRQDAYVRGGGDPFLISEDLAPLATELVAAVGKEPITGIVLDASYYPSNLRIPGIEDTDEGVGGVPDR